MMTRAADLKLTLIFAVACLFLSGTAQALDLVKKQTIVITGSELCPYNCSAQIDKEAFEKNYEVSLSGIAAVDPYSKTKVNGYGYVVDIVKAIYETLDYKVVYKIAESNKGLQRIKSGRYEILIDASPNRKLNKDVFYSKESIGRTKSFFYTTTDFDWNFAGVNYLNNVTLGLNKNQITPELKEYVKLNGKNPIKIQIIDDKNATRKNIEQLLRGRINVFFADKNVVEYNLLTMQLHDEIRNSGTFYNKKEAPLFLGFSASNKNAKKYAKIFDDGIKELRKSGKLVEIMTRYGLQDWEKEK